VPKGAAVEQRGLLNHLLAKIAALGLRAGDVVAQTASQCFDISVWQMLAALLGRTRPGGGGRGGARSGAAARRLPESMVPALFVWHEEMPLTPNGKLDRRALAGMDAGKGATREGGVAPRNPVEESLAGIWAEVLKLPAVGVYDDFFEIGGQSLLATQVVTRMREAFGVDLPVRSLFQKPTVAGLAESLEEALLHGRGLPPAPPMTRTSEAERQGPLEPSFGQERFWFIDQPRSARRNSMVSAEPRSPSKGTGVVCGRGTPAPPRVAALPVTARAPRVMPWYAL
jgi:hypothetical protein